MLTHIWTRKFGDGIIDTNCDNSSQTISFGDISGNAFISDYFGNIITEVQLSMPIWGVDHKYNDSNELLLATAHASKQTNEGIISVLKDDKEFVSINLDEPIWDIYIDLKFDQIIATGWKGNVYFVSLVDGLILEKIETNYSLYGISNFNNDNLIITADRMGILFLDLKTKKLINTLNIQNACYNVSFSEGKKYIVTGTLGPYIYCIDSADFSEKCRIEGVDIFSVYIIENILLTGSQEGILNIRSLTNPDFLLYSKNFKSSIWNISFDKYNENIYLALGNGEVACFHFDISKNNLNALDAYLIKRKNNDDIDILKTLKSGIESSILVDLVIKNIQDKHISEIQINEIRLYLEKRIQDENLESDKFLKGVLDFQNREYELAIIEFQSIDITNPVFSFATILLARSFLFLNEIESARKCLITNIDYINEPILQDALKILSDIKDYLGSPPVTRIQESRNFRSNDQKNIEFLDFGSVITKYDKGIGKQKGKKGLKREKDLNYGLINYIKYEYPNRADHAKKILEKNETEIFINKFLNANDKKLVSLDIGCATCRYPLWFSSLGFLARGYEIDDEAIKICKNIAKDNPRIEIFKRNILEEKPEKDEYSVITCMMGTFNHIEKSKHLQFLQWIYQSLKIHGLFIFSSWNVDCPYTSFLHFYNREDKELIQKNTRLLPDTTALLKDVGFIIKAEEPICFLTDECYENWMGSIDDNEILNIDKFLLEKLNFRNSQMQVFCAMKP